VKLRAWEIGERERRRERWTTCPQQAGCDVPYALAVRVAVRVDRKVRHKRGAGRGAVNPLPERSLARKTCCQTLLPQNPVGFGMWNRRLACFSKQAGGTPALLSANPTGFCGNSSFRLDSDHGRRLQNLGHVDRCGRSGATYVAVCGTGWHPVLQRQQPVSMTVEVLQEPHGLLGIVVPHSVHSA